MSGAATKDEVAEDLRVHDPEQLRQSLLASTVTARRRLHSECNRSTVGTEHGKPSEEESESPSQL